MYGKYNSKPHEWREALEMFLRKQEIIWVAKHGCAWVDFLKPYTVDLPTMLVYLRKLGFKIIGKTERDGDYHWIVTTCGTTICLEDGFCCEVHNGKS